MKCVTQANQYKSYELAEAALWAHAGAIKEATELDSEITHCKHCSQYHIFPKREKPPCWNHATYYISDDMTRCFICGFLRKPFYTYTHMEELGI